MSKAAIVYWSATGNTEAMAEAVLEGARTAGVDAALEQITPQKIAFSQKDRTLLFSISDIYCMEIRNHTILLRTKDGQYELRSSLKDIEAQLPSLCFAKPHNSYIVNLAEVRSLSTKNLTLTNGDQIPVSQRNRKPFEQALFQYVRR